MNSRREDPSQFGGLLEVDLGPGHYRDVSDVAHMSLAATVSPSGGSLKPMFRTISDVHYNDSDVCIRKGLFLTCRTPKVKMTSK
jgi:hypothetical protein